MLEENFVEEVVLEIDKFVVEKFYKIYSISIAVNMTCILYGFQCEMDFSPTREIRRGVVRNPSRMENHAKCIFSHTLHFNAL